MQHVHVPFMYGFGCKAVELWRSAWLLSLVLHICAAAVAGTLCWEPSPKFHFQRQLPDGQCASDIADIVLYVLLQVGPKYGVVSMANYYELMSLVEDPMDGDFQQLDSKLARAAQVS